VERNLDVGKVFSAVFAPDPEVGFRLAVAGSEGALQVWDTSTNAAIRRTFANKMASSESQPDIIKERLVGVDEDSSDSEVEGGASPGREGHHDAQDGWESMDEN
jgi:periodic tryptophan protein 1